MTEHANERADGIWTVNGLSAEFVVLYPHPNCDGIYRVRTATGDHYAHESELTFEHRIN